jgi:hypothetical protein
MNVHPQIVPPSVRIILLLALAIAGLEGCRMADATPEDSLSHAPLLQLEESFRLGGLESPEFEAFQGEPQLAVDQREFLYVLHPDIGQIAVFDGRGHYVRWIRGGRGDGPGEFTSAARLGMIGDTLWVRNRTPPRISRFLTDGAHVGTDQAFVNANYRTTAGVQGVTGYLQSGRAWMVPDGFVMAQAGSEAIAPFMLGNRPMEERSTLFSWRANRGRLAGTNFDPIPEPPFYDVASDGSRIVVADWSEATPAELVVRVIAPDGGELQSWSFAVAPTAVPQPVRDSLVQAGRDQVAEVRQRVIAQGIPEHSAPAVPTAADVRRAVYLPEYYPPIREVRAGIDGTFWLRRSDGLRPDRWVALDPSGVPQFAVVLPGDVRLRAASRAAVWGTTSDELGVPYVIRWNVTPASSLAPNR